jgi:hypothetical protein
MTCRYSQIVSRLGLLPQGLLHRSTQLRGPSLVSLPLAWDHTNSHHPQRLRPPVRQPPSRVFQDLRRPIVDLMKSVQPHGNDTPLLWAVQSPLPPNCPAVKESHDREVPYHYTGRLSPSKTTTSTMMTALTTTTRTFSRTK